MAKEKLVALDVGSASLKAVEAVVKNGVPTITKVASIPLDSEIVENGEITAPELLSTNLRNLWRVGRFESRAVYSLATGSGVFNRVVPDLDWAQQDDFKEMLPFILKDQLPFPVDEFYLDAHTLDEYVKPGQLGLPTRYKTALVSGVPRGYIDNMVSAIQGAGLRPVSIDTLPFALIRAYAHSTDNRGDENIIASIELGAEETNIVVHEGGQPVYLHSARLGGRGTTDQIARQLQLSFIEAEFLKIALSSPEEARRTMSRQLVLDGGLPKLVTFDSFDEDQVETAQVIISQEVSNIIAHIEDVIEAAAAEVDEDINVIVLSGGAAELSTLSQRLENETNIAVRFARPFETVRPGRVRPEILAHQQAFTAVTGLLLGKNGIVQ